MPRRPTAECSRLLHYLLCFLCFLAAPTCIADRESNSLLGTPLQSSSSFYLLWSSVQILWMLTYFLSLNRTPTHTDHQLSNAWLFDKSHYWGSKQQKTNLKNVKTKSPFIRMRVRIQLRLACTKSFFRESVPCPPLPWNSLVLHSLQYLTRYCHSWRDVNLCVSFLLLFNCLVLLILIHSTSITYSVFHKNFTNNYFFNISWVQFSRSVMSDSLWLHELQHTRPSCTSPTPGLYPKSCPLCQWCHPTISSSVVLFSSCPQSFPESESFPMSQLFASGGQSIGVSASTSVLPMNSQDWFPLEWTGWISVQSKGLSRVFSNTTVQKHQFFGIQLSL